MRGGWGAPCADANDAGLLEPRLRWIERIAEREA
jgi:hypothetical protein